MRQFENRQERSRQCRFFFCDFLGGVSSSSGMVTLWVHSGGMVLCMVDSSAPTTMTMAVLQEPPDKLRHMNASAAGEPSRAPWRTGALPEFNVDVDISEVYFLIMHFLSSGPCQRAFVHLSNEILQHKLLPRRYHAVFSREGVDKKEDGMSFPLTYQDILSRYIL